MYLAATELTLPKGVTITGSSVPLDLADVATIIAEISAEIDGAAAVAGYAVPIATSATVGYAWIQSLAKNGAGWRVLRVVFPNLGGPGDQASLVEDCRRAYVDGLKLLREGKQPLVGASEETSDEVRALPRSFSTSNPGETVGVEPQISIGWEP